LTFITNFLEFRFSYTWIDGSVNPVIIPLNRIDPPLPDLKSFLERVMESNKHYYTLSSQKIFLLNISVSQNKYRINSDFTHIALAKENKWTIPDGATWESPVFPIMPMFNVPATNFRDLIGFDAGSYPDTTITGTLPAQTQIPSPELLSPYFVVSKYVPQIPKIILPSQIPLQRWNHIFINFNNDGMMDVFLNNKLETSVPNVFPPLLTSLTVGKNKGIYGQACNIVYYRSVLGSDGISWIYNTHKHLNPPTSPIF